MRSTALWRMCIVLLMWALPLHGGLLRSAFVRVFRAVAGEGGTVHDLSKLASVSGRRSLWLPDASVTPDDSQLQAWFHASDQLNRLKSRKTPLHRRGAVRSTVTFDQCDYSSRPLRQVTRRLLTSSHSTELVNGTRVVFIAQRDSQARTLCHVIVSVALRPCGWQHFALRCAESESLADYVNNSVNDTAMSLEIELVGEDPSQSAAMRLVIEPVAATHSLLVRVLSSSNNIDPHTWQSVVDAVVNAMADDIKNQYALLTARSKHIRLFQDQTLAHQRDLEVERRNRVLHPEKYQTKRRRSAIENGAGGSGRYVPSDSTRSRRQRSR